MSDEDSPDVGRSIHIGRDATGNTIVSGDGNVIVIESTRLHAAEAPAPPGAADIGPNPYMGLLAFDETDADRFFGRQEQTARLWERLRDLHSHVSGERPTRLLPVLGPSGSGKSSLARAGLIAELARRPLPGMRRARVAVMTPGAHPVEALAGVLARIATNDPTPVAKTTEFEAALMKRNDHGECDGLRRIADALPDIAGAPLIVLVDQFEGIYSLCTDRSERTLFIDNLLLAARDAGRHVSVVITLRTDFLGETQTHEALNAVICEQQVMIPAMSEEGLRQAIARPAEEAGHPLDDAMVALLLSDTRGRDGALPLLQFALTRIWDGMGNGVEPAVTYREIGGVGGALAGEAQRIYQSLNDQEKRIAKRVFLGLVQLGEGTRDTRRRAEVKSLIGVADDPKHVEGVIRRFSAPDVRLITLSADERGGADIAEVTHEALFDRWRQLSNWVEDSREDVRFQRRLDDVAVNWDEQGRPEGGLWRPPDLDLLTQFHGRATEDMTPLQMDFFDASRAAERRRLEATQREDRRRRRTLIVASATITVFLLMGVSIGSLVIALRSASSALDARAETELTRESLAEAQAVVSANSEREFQLNLSRLSRGRQLQLEDLRETALRSIEGLQRLYDRDDKADPVLSRALALAYRRLGDVQGGTRTGSQGDTQAALESYRTALAILKRVNPPNADISRDLSSSHVRIGDILLTTGNVSDALVEYQAAVDYVDSLMLAGHSVDRTHVIALSSAGHALVSNGRTEEAEELYKRSLALRRQLAKAAPNSALAQHDLAKGLASAAERRSVAGEYDAALELYFESLGIRERLLAEDPNNSTRKRDVAVVHYFLFSTFSALDQLATAKPHVQSWLDYTKERAQASPDDARAHRDLVAAYELMGIMLADAGEWDQASKSYRDMQEVIVPLREFDPANTQYGRLLASSYQGLGEVALATDDIYRAVAKFRSALEIIVPMSEHDPDDARIKSDRARLESSLGDALFQNGAIDDTLTHLETARELYDTLFEKDPATVDNREGLALTLQRLASALSAQGDTAAAIKRVNEALAILDASVETPAMLELRSSLEEDLARYQRESESDG